jgi:hypothetical protein
LNAGTCPRLSLRREFSQMAIHHCHPELVSGSIFFTW